MQSRTYGSQQQSTPSGTQQPGQQSQHTLEQVAQASMSLLEDIQQQIESVVTFCQNGEFQRAQNSWNKTYHQIQSVSRFLRTTTQLAQRHNSQSSHSSSTPGSFNLPDDTQGLQNLVQQIQNKLNQQSRQQAA